MDWKKYTSAFVITSIIFFTAITLSSYFNDKRIDEIKSIENTIAVDILSLETEFELFQELSCDRVAEKPVLSSELGSLGQRLNYTERSLGTNNTEVMRLKQSYSLLEIKDFLLMKQIAEKCDNIDPIFIFYFYSNSGDCKDCTKEGHVLTALKQKYPTVRIYSFDYHLALSVLKTFISINNIENNLPALLIDDTVYYGFHSVEDIEEILPELEELQKIDEERGEEV